MLLKIKNKYCKRLKIPMLLVESNKFYDIDLSKNKRPILLRVSKKNVYLKVLYNGRLGWIYFELVDEL